ncbi:MAG: response regulator [Candidatus Cloacimonetes bacterium]|nr:response regulator [Candidatus Cloacimonadota bacterium]
MQNVLLNLILNASYAIKGNGEILIQTKNVYLDDRYCDESTFDVTPGNYLELLIKDSGEGISPENISKVFEPFFTTKPQVEGTGLGLSSAYGTIFEHLGVIQVDSKLEVGTEFRILLACTQDTPFKKPEPHALQTFSGLILLVDDEEIIRMTATSMLENMGFKVINAANGAEAIEIYKKQSHEIDLCILDMIMPKLNGKDTFYELKGINADCQVILSSGYVKDDKLKTLLKDGLSGFISKPYRYSDLNKVISDIKTT